MPDRRAGARLQRLFGLSTLRARQRVPRSGRLWAKRLSEAKGKRYAFPVPLHFFRPRENPRLRLSLRFTVVTVACDQLFSEGKSESCEVMDFLAQSLGNVTTTDEA